MIEHRLIERMIAVIGRLLAEAETGQKLDPADLDNVVDFVRTYADRTHHGKEEGILFRDLARKPMSVRDRQVMRELMEEHDFGRGVTKQLAEASGRFRRGDASALSAVTGALRTLASFYPKHIAKEDVDFFLACRAYLSEDEEQAMVREFCDFDRRMIHDRYRRLCDELSERQAPAEAPGRADGPADRAR